VSGGGGSHEVLWEEYLAGLKRLESQVAASGFLAAEIAQISAKLVSAQKVLTLDGSRKGNWPSKIRNEINYRHSLGVWWPHPASNNVEYYLNLLKSCLSQDPMKNDLDEAPSLEAFAKICLFVINLTRVIVIDMAGLEPSGKSFQEAGPMTLLRRGRLTR
jgi:hypothetical protein